MTTYVFANNATTTLASPISSGSTTITLASGTGALFPNPTSSQQFALTLLDAATKLVREIIYVTARSTDTLTVVRAREGTTAASWLAGDYASNDLTAATLAAMSQQAFASASATLTSSTSITSAYAGFIITVGGSATTQTLVAASTVPNMALGVSASAACTLASAGGNIVGGGVPGGSTISLSMLAGDTICLQSNGTNWTVMAYSFSGGQVPIGSGMDYWGTTAPANYVFAYGQLLNISVYPSLYTVFGTTYGGDGVTTFGVPDKRGRTSFGVDNMGGTTAGRLTNAGSGITGTTLGASGGDQSLQTHNHGVNDPGHSHGISDPGHTHSVSDPSHNHGISDPGHSHSIPSGYVIGGGALNDRVPNGSTEQTNIAGTGISINNAFTGIAIYGAYTGIYTQTATTSITIQSTGAGGSQNVPPGIVCNYIIRAA